jgi:predicted MPP superfamily phosphohydrolase
MIVGPWFRHLLASSILLMVIAAHLWVWSTLAALRGGRPRSERWRAGAGLVILLSIAFVAGGLSLSFQRVLRAVPEGRWTHWTRAAAFAWALLSCCVAAALWLRAKAPPFDPTRRKLMGSAAATVLAAPAAAGGFGVFLARSNITARQTDLRVAGLPRDLEGLRLAQLSDIHLGPFLGAKELAVAVGIANDFRANVALVTGDLVSEWADSLDACLRGLSALRASDGILGCLGNHEEYLRAEFYTTYKGRRYGLDFLRDESRILRFGGATLNFAGVDYQRMGGPYLEGADRLVENDCINVLLSHNPDVFPVAAAQGYQLVISGHTHGGQVSIPGLPLNAARLYTPYICGQYRHGSSLLYVSAGIGTVAVPVRLGVPPEVNLITLRPF